MYEGFRLDTVKNFLAKAQWNRCLRKYIPVSFTAIMLPINSQLLRGLQQSLLAHRFVEWLQWFCSGLWILLRSAPCRFSFWDPGWSFGGQKLEGQEAKLSQARRVKISACIPLAHASHMARPPTGKWSGEFTPPTTDVEEWVFAEQ